MRNQLEQGFIKPSNQGREGREGTCPYCGKGRIPSKKKEHIFNASWGGKASSKKLICDSCNARFARTIDLAFKPITDRVQNMWGMAPNRSKKVPEIHIEDGLVIGPYNILHGKGITFDYTEEDHKFNFKISANSKSEIKRFIDNGELETAIGKTLTDKHKEEIKAQLTFTDKQETEPTYSQPRLKVSIDLKDQYRSAMHTAIKTILLYTPSSLNQFGFKQAIDFIYSGHSDFRDFALLTKEFVLPPIETPTANFVSIYFSRKYKKIIGCFSLQNRIKLSFILAEYDGNQDVMMLVSEGFNGGPNLFAFKAVVPSHLSALPLVEITSDSLTDADIENMIKDLFIHIQYKDGQQIKENLAEYFQNDK